MKHFTTYLLAVCSFGFTHLTQAQEYEWHDIEVTATAYNSVVAQTNTKPRLTAFGDDLKPDMKVIAVSRDLFLKGLKHNTPVKIKGLEGVYYVKDRMPSRWKNKIDIYMGNDIKAARMWGRRKVSISYGKLKTNP